MWVQNTHFIATALNLLVLSLCVFHIWLMDR